ncbi:inositol phosphorylceramide synthase catalytic subunit AUR1-like [Anneissia japonica]|uniref:inositol phosphorylceramide synthase catalytic subunit AUR1-like n=1 Tax=Anneissia japonica TaxID=1529436 RepID=UPI0014257DF5|nr:inositol phosphorylceramide synthase catalytic subunit AUR1-like [Anneissia japonica]XP_033126661.1 inositol phosphorylceramide synthase catalytic subunit AUR1-like [Anneissia japonica]
MAPRIHWTQGTAVSKVTTFVKNAPIVHCGFTGARRTPLLGKILLSFIPFGAYLVTFTFYHELQKLIGLDEKPVSTTFLPWLEHSLFHCYPHKILSSHTTPVLDFVAAIPYLFHFILPLVFSLYLIYVGRRHDVPLYLWIAGWVNFIAVLVQLISPTASPWFVDSVQYDEHGNIVSVAENEAGFKRVDAMLGYPLFHNLYGKSKVKFGAFPSLHVAWPAVVMLFRPWFGYRFGAFHVCWIIWASMYTCHHYLVDGLAGVTLAFVVYTATMKLYHPFTCERERDVIAQEYIPVTNKIPYSDTCEVTIPEKS